MRAANDDDLEYQLGLIEELIMTLEQADAFAEDLIRLHARRQTMAAALSTMPGRFEGRLPVPVSRVIPAAY